MDLEGLKQCIRCGSVKTLTGFYAVSNSGKTSDGEPVRRMSWCIECHKKYSKQQRLNRLLRDGQKYLDEESVRVRRYSNEENADNRRASERAKSAAVRELIIRHDLEYKELLRVAKKAEGLP